MYLLIKAIRHISIRTLFETIEITYDLIEFFTEDDYDYNSNNYINVKELNFYKAAK